MKAAALALKAGAEREALRAEVPRRNADAIVVVDCMRKKKCWQRKDYRKKSYGKKWITAIPRENPTDTAETGIRVNGLYSSV